MKQSLILFILVFAPISLVSGHGGESPSEDPQTDGFTLTLPEIYAITIVVGIVLALLLYRYEIVRSRKMLYEMVGIAIVLLTIDFYLMNATL